MAGFLSSIFLLVVLATPSCTVEPPAPDFDVIAASALGAYCKVVGDANLGDCTQDPTVLPPIRTGISPGSSDVDLQQQQGVLDQLKTRIGVEIEGLGCDSAPCSSFPLMLGGKECVSIAVGRLVPTVEDPNVRKVVVSYEGPANTGRVRECLCCTTVLTATGWESTCEPKTGRCLPEQSGLESSDDDCLLLQTKEEVNQQTRCQACVNECSSDWAYASVGSCQQSDPDSPGRLIGAPYDYLFVVDETAEGEAFAGTGEVLFFDIATGISLARRPLDGLALQDPSGLFGECRFVEDSLILNQGGAICDGVIQEDCKCPD